MSVGKASIKRALGAKEPVAAPEEVKAPVAAEPAKTEKKPAKKPAAKKPAAKKPAKKAQVKKPATVAPEAPIADKIPTVSLGDDLPYYLL